MKYLFNISDVFMYVYIYIYIHWFAFPGIKYLFGASKEPLLP